MDTPSPKPTASLFLGVVGIVVGLLILGMGVFLRGGSLPHSSSAASVVPPTFPTSVVAPTRPPQRRKLLRPLFNNIRRGFVGLLALR